MFSGLCACARVIGVVVVLGRWCCMSRFDRIDFEKGSIGLN